MILLFLLMYFPLKKKKIECRSLEKEIMTCQLCSTVITLVEHVRKQASVLEYPEKP